MADIKHEGRGQRRLNIHNMEEVIFADEWKMFNHQWRGSNVLASLLNEEEDRFNISRITQRDAFVAATIVQWLGTNVGSGFLQKCLERIKKEKPDNKIAREMLQRLKGR